MKETIEFDIPDGYMLDSVDSKVGKLVFKLYEPKKGDLVRLFASPNGFNSKDVIKIYDCPATTPCIATWGNGLSGNWHFSNLSLYDYGALRLANDYEIELFTRILAENGYKYDAEKKEVRKKDEDQNKRWRAGIYMTYWRITEDGVKWNIETQSDKDNLYYQIGNYFRTRDEAEQVAEQFKNILKNR